MSETSQEKTVHSIDQFSRSVLIEHNFEEETNKNSSVYCRMNKENGCTRIFNLQLAG
jgi:hypothetical protein